MLIVVDGVTNWRCYADVCHFLLYISRCVFPFFYGSSLPFMVFKANIHLMSLYLQYVCGRENYSVQSSVIWRQRYTTTSLSKKQKRKDRYNCMCVCVLSMQDNSNTGWVWWMRAVCVQPSSNTQLAGREYLCAMCHAHKSNQGRVLCNDSLHAVAGKSSPVKMVTSLKKKKKK